MESTQIASTHRDHDRFKRYPFLPHYEVGPKYYLSAKEKALVDHLVDTALNVDESARRLNVTFGSKISVNTVRYWLDRRPELRKAIGERLLDGGLKEWLTKARWQRLVFLMSQGLKETVVDGIEFKFDRYSVMRFKLLGEAMNYTADDRPVSAVQVNFLQADGRK